MIFKYQFTTDEDQAMLDMLQYFDDIGLPSHRSKNIRDLSDKFSTMQVQTQ